MKFLRPTFSVFCLPIALLRAAEPVQTLPAVQVTGSPAVTGRLALPQATETISALRIEEAINTLDAEDAVKYLPSVFLRKRNAGDTQAVLATRTWGVSSSARSLVYADGVLLSALIANNNSSGGPRWGLVAPSEIERVDVMHGPFSAAFPGNAMGAVVEITTRLPERREAALSQAFAWQSFRQYGTRETFRTAQTAATAGARAGKFSFWLSGNFQDSHSQPLNYVTSATFPAGTSGAYPEKNKFGQPAHVVGASGLLHTRMANAKVKLAWEIAPALRASYTLGRWQADTAARAETYLRDAAGAPTFAGITGFASGRFEQEQAHTSHSLGVKSDPPGAFGFEAVGTFFRMDRDAQRLPAAANASGTGFSRAGRLAQLAGTGWSTLDLKGTWRAGERGAGRTIAFGAHDDRFTLRNPTYNLADWENARTTASIATEGRGRTRTQALWAHDAWQMTRAFKLTLGARYERWRASDGLNVNGATTVRQPGRRDRGLSPKAAAIWTLSPRWTATFSIARAYRFATVAELYQLVSTGATFTAPNANLKPDDVAAAEIRLEHRTLDGRVRLSLFQDDVHDVIMAQSNPLVPGSTQLFSFASNVDHVRARGIEFVVERNHVFTPGLELSGNVTYLDARTLATRGQGQFGSAIGKRLPNIPDWRASVGATWRPDERWTLTLAARYSGMLFTTLDAADTNPNTWQGFSAWCVVDARVHHRIGQRWSVSLGVDNLLDRKYFVFHPFPQRTFVADAKLRF